MKHLLIILAFINLLASPLSSAADDKTGKAVYEAGGFGLGAILGGLIAGPPGMVLGAAGGAIYGNHEGREKHQLIATRKELQDKEIELSIIREELAGIHEEYATGHHRVNLETERFAQKTLSESISLSVFFRTDDSTVRNELKPHLQRLAHLLEKTPKINIILDAYADRRGDETYNYNLSKDRAVAVERELIQAGLSQDRITYQAHGEHTASERDRESYMFDRRVDITLTLDTEA